MARMRQLDINCWEAALNRLRQVYSEGHRVVVAFSGGKDSGIVLNLAILAAREVGRLPVEAVFRDEEIQLPGTFEYAEQVRAMPEVDLHWIFARQAVPNAFNREMPYWWVFDDRLKSSEWVREPPPWAVEIDNPNIRNIIDIKDFPPPPEKKLIKLLGLRACESQNRRMGIHMSGGWLTTGCDVSGALSGRPVYDWSDRDVWKAYKDYGWPYNSAYDVMFRYGTPSKDLRIAPPTIWGGIKALKMAKSAWPKWFDQVCMRVPGTRAAAMFGKQILVPFRKDGETWEQCTYRVIEQAPEWLRERDEKILKGVIEHHRLHSNSVLHETHACEGCSQKNGSRETCWKWLAQLVYYGDPFHQKQNFVKTVEMSVFRPGYKTGYSFD